MAYKPDDYLTLKEVEVHYGICRSTVYNYKKNMELFPEFRVGIALRGRRIRFKELEEFIQFTASAEYKQELKKKKAVIR